MERKMEILREKLLLLPDVIYEPEYYVDSCGKCMDCRAPGAFLVNCDMCKKAMPMRAVIVDIEIGDKTLELTYDAGTGKCFRYSFTPPRTWNKMPFTTMEACKQYCDGLEAVQDRRCASTREAIGGTRCRNGTKA